MSNNERKRIRELTPYIDVLLDYVQELINQEYDLGWDASQIEWGTRDD